MILKLLQLDDDRYIFKDKNGNLIPISVNDVDVVLLIGDTIDVKINVIKIL